MTGNPKHFQRTRRATLARLDRVNHAIARRDEWDAAQDMPPNIQPEVERPVLG